MTSIYLFFVFFSSPHFWCCLIVSSFSKHGFLVKKLKTSCCKVTSAMKTRINCTLLCIASLLLILIVISNTSLLNPGHAHNDVLSYYFHNVQGLATLNSVGKVHPDLNITKLLELQTYIFQYSPDIVILNETWLKNTINSKEIIPGDVYKVFRRDRSCLSHPPDPNNPKKFKRNGGGVLIAIKDSLNLNPKEIKTSCKAEILSVELTLPNKKKISISTHYRVGTLGIDSLNELRDHLYNIFRAKKYKNNFIVGDMNLEAVNWQDNSSNNNLLSSYVDLFSDIGVSQLISESAHRSGNILDILLSDTPELVNDVRVHLPGCFTNSDHSPLTFGLRMIIKRKKADKKSIYNYKKANWTNLNRDLNRVDWHFILDTTEPDFGWNIFKKKFLLLCDKHIPKIKIKESFLPPWFDSDVFKLNKKKEHFRKLFKESKNPQHYKKFSSLRKKLKTLIKAKMRSNFDDDLCPNTITKKFWSSLKSISKSSRIPDKMYLNDCIRSRKKLLTSLTSIFTINFLLKAHMILKSILLMILSVTLNLMNLVYLIS